MIKPRMVSDSTLIGWLLAKPFIHEGSVSGGTKIELANIKGKSGRKPAELAASGETWMARWVALVADGSHPSWIMPGDGRGTRLGGCHSRR